jgi:glycosyltransferase involved in cell wall biosynthesis
MKRLRVLQIVSGLSVEGPLGGAGRFVIELARALDRAAVEPMIAAIWDYHTGFEQKWSEQLTAEGVPNIIAADWDEVAPYRSCVRSLRALQERGDFSADILHSHGEFTDLAAIYLRRPLRAKRIMRTVHSAVEWSKRRLYGRFFSNVLYPLAFDREVAVSQRATHNLNARLLAQVRRQRVSYVPNAINFRRFDNLQMDRARKRLELGLPADVPVIGAVGRLAAVKGFRDLISAVPAVLAQHPDVYFLIVGDGVEGAQLRAQAQALGVAERVFFAGARSDVEEILACIDLFVSSSLIEGLPTVILESMAVRVPVVASRIPGNMELVTDGETGLVAPAANPPELASVINTALARPEHMRLMASTAHRMVRDRFSIEAVAKQYADLYVELLGGH